MSNPRKALVVLTHGFLGARVQFLPMAASLARKYDVLNFGYRSRANDLESHAESLIDAVQARLRRKEQVAHFVTHSFGGLVLHRAFAKGLGEILDSTLHETRCVLIAPPMRGASFARAFRRENVVGPEMLKTAIHSTARIVLGNNAGSQLMMNDELWFEKELGTIPKAVNCLLVVGRAGRLNPLISGESDGVVGIDEATLNRDHHRLEVKLTHNLLLYSPLVMKSISAFLEGQGVGTFVTGLRETSQAP